ncbi:hypothetical protein [Alicyclobacillus tolerans]|uniref:Uncharacterized protein n=1 Tax=Alicyclobacillus tolerans TaxID=90970 RepID=A0A1M6XSX2_9BACL|nr:hypothetical protein [Alicyclobacillus montanus]SHL09120.1 hypothetical protein SAMN05443507_13710 [Alicyclobacillus montanus]
MTKIDITRIEAIKDQKAPVYMHYQGQYSAQPAFIALDEYGNVSADYESEVGSGMPESVYHRRTLRFPIAPNCSGEMIYQAVIKAMHDLQFLHDEHVVEHDGHNWVEYLSSDAAYSTQDKLHSFFAETCCGDIDIYDAPDDFFNDCSDNWIDPFIEHQQQGDLEAYVQECMEMIDENVLLNFDLDEAVEYISKHITKKC